MTAGKYCIQGQGLYCDESICKAMSRGQRDKALLLCQAKSATRDAKATTTFASLSLLSDIGHWDMGMKQGTGPKNRTRDLQSNHAIKSGVQTPDLQKHHVHEEHESYRDFEQKIQIACTISMWNASDGWWMATRLFQFSKFTQIHKKGVSLDILDQDQVKTSIYLEGPDLHVCTCGKQTTEMVYRGKYLIIVDFHFHFWIEI